MEFGAVGKCTHQGASAFIIAAHSVIALAAESKSSLFDGQFCSEAGDRTAKMVKR